MLKEVKIKLSRTALRVLEKRYLKRDESGEIAETPEGLFRRVARGVAGAELLHNSRADVSFFEQQFYNMMAGLEFLPNSPTLLNAGIESGQLSSCFAVPIEDSIESIFDSVKAAVIIHKSGGGTGFCLSSIRPAGDNVNGGEGISSGPVPLLEILSNSADYVRQGGVRRGCNAAILSVRHPDILDFIKAKNDPESLTNFYISVAVDNKFMDAVKSGVSYDLINPRNGHSVGRMCAGFVFDRLVEQAWKNGEPGILFIDHINSDNPTPKMGILEHASGCGEQLLLPNESCNMGSINLVKMLSDNGHSKAVDFEKLANTVKMAVRFLDNVIDINSIPLPEVDRATKKTRKVGLGVMGFADMLIQLGIPYNSEEAVRVAEDVMGFIQKEAHNTSAQLAKERDAFPAISGSTYDFLGGRALRNATCTTIAPTGTLSLIADCSSGIEPVFSLAMVRNIMDGEKLLGINSYFEQVAKSQGFYSRDLLEKLVVGQKLDSLEYVPEKLKELFITAHKIAPEWHLKIQAAFQKHTDNAVSKTVNFDSNASIDDVAQVFLKAYELGLKGITVYRNGSRKQQPLSTGHDGLRLVKEYLGEND